ncbi:MAG: basic rane protein [Thermoleophilaceae bacterium]|jgi:basic membrane lipoprotein Med (substrate-binding protein (PBP1-ABC) superfamily)|nr:basic rane protein [Thermoleophilaceae bacterium]
MGKFVRRSPRRWGIAVWLSALLVVASGCGTTSDSGGSETASSGDNGKKDTLNVGLVYVSATNDQGWSQAFDIARTQVEESLGEKVNITFKQNVPDGPDAQRVMEQMVRDGNDVIIATSFGQGRGTKALAAKYPDTKFLLVEGGPTELENLATYDINAAEGFYVAGMAAAAVSKQDMLGVVGGFPIPPQLATLNAFALGAQSINPDATVRMVWTNDWYSVSKAQSAASALINAGAGAVTHFTTGPSVGQVAEREGIPWISYEVNLEEFGPKHHLTSVIYNWGPYLEDQFQKMIDGSWAPEFTFGGMEDHVVELGPFGAPYEGVSDADKQKIEEATKGLQEGSMEIFEGPVVDRSGKVRVEEGSTATPEELYTTDYVVKGVLGSLPKAGE